MKAKETGSFFLVCIYAVLLALNYIIFIFPNEFAPAGIDGICKMIQDVSNVSMGYLSLVANIPLFIAAFICLENKRFIYKSMLFVIVFSITVLVFKYIGIAEYGYYTVNGTSTVMAPVIAGLIRGLLYIVTLKEKACAGGVDIIAAIVKKYKPYYNMMYVVFSVNLCVAITAYFVYGFKIEPVICSIIYALITTITTNSIKKSSGESVKFEIITTNAKEMCEEITKELNLHATVTSVSGGYTGEDKEMLISIVNKKDAPMLEDTLKKYHDIVVFESIINNSITESDYRF